MFNASYSLMLPHLWLVVLSLFSLVEEERMVEEYEKYRQKEHKKHEAFSRRFIKDPDSIDW